MATIKLRGKPVRTSGDLPATGSTAPAFSLTDKDLKDQSLSAWKGRKKLLNIFPSIDTPTCAMSVCTFNEKASAIGDAVVLCIAADLPFAMSRFCGAKGLDRVVTLSTFRGGAFLTDYGVRIEDGPLAGLAARACLVLDGDDKVLHAELVEEIADEPDYDAALKALAD